MLVSHKEEYLKIANSAIDHGFGHIVAHTHLAEETSAFEKLLMHFQLPSLHKLLHVASHGKIYEAFLYHLATQEQIFDAQLAHEIASMPLKATKLKIAGINIENNPLEITPLKTVYAGSANKKPVIIIHKHEIKNSNIQLRTLVDIIKTLKEYPKTKQIDWDGIFSRFLELNIRDNYPNFKKINTVHKHSKKNCMIAYFDQEKKNISLYEYQIQLLKKGLYLPLSQIGMRANPISLDAPISLDQKTTDIIQTIINGVETNEFIEITDFADDLGVARIGLITKLHQSHNPYHVLAKNAPVQTKNILMDIAKTYQKPMDKQEKSSHSALIGEIDAASHRISYSALLAACIIAGAVLLQNPNLEVGMLISAPFFIIAAVIGVVFAKKLFQAH